MASKRGKKNIKRAAEKSHEAKRIVMTTNCHKQEETPSPTKTVAKFEGVRQKKSKWVAEIKDPIKKIRVWLGTYETPQKASEVYESKKMEIMENKVLLAAAEKKRERKRKSDQDDQGIEKGEISKSCSVFNEENVAVSKKMKTQEANKDQESSSPVLDDAISSNEKIRGDNFLEAEGFECNILVEFGKVVIDRYGRILGEFSWIDDLRLEL